MEESVPIILEKVTDMSSIVCEVCGLDSETLKFCSHCGSELPSDVDPAEVALEAPNWGVVRIDLTNLPSESAEELLMEVRSRLERLEKATIQSRVGSQSKSLFLKNGIIEFVTANVFADEFLGGSSLLDGAKVNFIELDSG